MNGIYSQFGEPVQLPVQRLDERHSGPEAPRYCVSPLRSFITCGEVGEDAKVVIADLGEAFLQNQPPQQLHAPVLPLPPEVLFYGRSGPEIDVWTWVYAL